MTDFPMLKIKMLTNFPSQAYGGVGITVNYNAGAYTINLDYSKFPTGLFPTDLTNSYVLIWNAITGIYQLATVSQLPYAPLNNPVFTGDPQAPTAPAGDSDNSIATTAFVNGVSRVVTAAGAVTIASADRVVAINKTVGAATAVSLPVASTKNGPVVIADIKRDAGTNNITITPNGAETIEGLATLTLAANGASAQLWPLSGVGWAVS